MKREQAEEIAERIKMEMKPFCSRIEIAGSIRRKKPEVKDIEIVAIPLPYQTGLFEDGLAAIVNKWQKVKGEMEYGICKYTQRILPDGIKLDLFFADEVNWGFIYAIRTGSADYSAKILGAGWVANGYKGIDGQLTYQGKVIEVREEADLFRRAGIKYIEPEYRNV